MTLCPNSLRTFQINTAVYKCISTAKKPPIRDYLHENIHK